MTRVLVPVAILEGETIGSGLMTLLSTVDVTVLDYHVLPEQTPPDQARAQFEERAISALDDLSEEFRAAGSETDHRLVFTHDRRQTIDRVAADTDSAAYLTTGTTGDVDQLLVSLTGGVDVAQIITFVEELIGDREIGVTLFAAGEAADERLENRDTPATVDIQERDAVGQCGEELARWFGVVEHTHRDADCPDKPWRVVSGFQETGRNRKKATKSPDSAASPLFQRTVLTQPPPGRKADIANEAFENG